MTVPIVEREKGGELPVIPIEADLRVTRAREDNELNSRRKKLLAVFEKTSLGERLLNLKEADMASMGVDGNGCDLEFIYEYRAPAKCEAA